MKVGDIVIDVGIGLGVLSIGVVLLGVSNV